jgi:hypothetical protein
VKKTDPFRSLMDIVRELDAAKIAYTVARNRYDGISIQAVVPGERWEIDVLEDGSVDFERFASDGDIADRDALTACIAQFSEPE